MFFLCDPGLMLPPEDEDLREHERFWRKLVEWASDRRVALGPETHDLIVRHFEREGWPDYQPPLCPEGLSGLARSAVNRILSTKREPVSAPASPASLDPTYIRHEDGELAIAIDVTSKWDMAPVALASAEKHWDPPSKEVSIDPPPPETIELVTEPNIVTAHEEVALLQQRLSSRRINIIGGLRDNKVCEQICNYLGVKTSSIRWIESEPGQQPQTDRLKGMRGHSDVLCCVIGCQGIPGLGHAGTETAVDLARNRGVAHSKVERPSQVLEALVKLLQRKS